MNTSKLRYLDAFYQNKNTEYIFLHYAITDS